jgi:hypothetical protein
MARCSLKTVRRAYTTGALTAYRRRGSRAVLLDPRDVLAWATGEIVEPIRPMPALDEPAAARPEVPRRVGPDVLTSRVASQSSFDLSASSLRARRTAAIQQPRRRHG